MVGVVRDLLTISKRCLAMGAIITPALSEVSREFGCVRLSVRNTKSLRNDSLVLSVFCMKFDSHKVRKVTQHDSRENVFMDKDGQEMPKNCPQIRFFKF